MAQSAFGTGNMWGIPAGANPTPVRFATLQDVTVNFSFDLKKLYGGSQFPVEQGRGKGSIDIKASVARIDPILFNSVFYGGAITALSEILNSVDETFVAATTYTTANAATFKADLGIYDATSVKYLTRVASAPTTGQYSLVVATGIYTLAVADAGHTMRVSYTYGSSTTGSTITVTNAAMGSGPIFGIDLVQTFRGKSMFLAFPAVQAPKLGMPLKLDDFMMSSIDMSAQDDGSGNVFTHTITG